MVNVPKTKKTFCKGKACGKHTLHKITQVCVVFVFLVGADFG